MTIKNNKIIDSKVMTLLDIAKYLKVSQKTVLRMLQKQKINGFKIGNQWRFLKPVIDDWLTNKMQVVPKKNLLKVIQTAKKIIPLTKLITKNRILLNIQNGTKANVLEQLVEPLYKEKLISNKKEYIEKLLKREKIISTAIGYGVAFPHLRNPKENQVKDHAIVLGVCKKGTNFKSLDGNKTFLFGLIATNSELVHLRLLAKLSLLFRDNDIVKQIVLSNNISEVMTTLNNLDVQIKVNQEIKNEFQ